MKARIAAPIVGGLIGRVIEDLKELRTTQMEHELREEREALRKHEGVRIILVVLAELLTLKHNVENGGIGG